jgi:hypothetical protein
MFLGKGIPGSVDIDNLMTKAPHRVQGLIS